MSSAKLSIRMQVEQAMNEVVEFSLPFPSSSSSSVQSLVAFERVSVSTQFYEKNGSVSSQ